MNTIKLKLIFGICLLGLAVPSSAWAYFTTDQNSTVLSSDTVLFSITYKFGFINRELYMPIYSKRIANPDTLSPFVGYTILDDTDKSTQIGQAYSVVLTQDPDVEVRDGQYYLPAGKAAEFTVTTFLRGETAEITGTRMLLTHLPFTMVVDGKEVPARLNPSELQYYRTPTIKTTAVLLGK